MVNRINVCIMGEINVSSDIVENSQRMNGDKTPLK